MEKAMPVVLEHVTTATDDARTLIEELETELSGLYSAEQRHGYSVQQVFQPNILFFVARLDGEIAGCGGIAFETGFAEVKRMFVRPAARGRGIGRAVLARLEHQAREKKVTRLTLETGDVLHAAIHLYERAGFTRCAPFGPYARMTPRAIERSVFLEKHIV